LRLAETLPFSSPLLVGDARIRLHVCTLSSIVTKREGPYTTAMDDRAPDVDLSDPDLLIQTQTS
jgi:hypothetical protein